MRVRHSEREIRYEDSAHFVTNVKGWVCTECKRFYGNEEGPAGGEHMARWCCSNDQPCSVEGCDGRARDGWSNCGGCVESKRRERYEALTPAEWDGETALWADCGTFFFDVDQLRDHLVEALADRVMRPEELNLQICEKEFPPEFSINDHLCDFMPEDHYISGESAINEKVSAIISKAVADQYNGSPHVWAPGGPTRPTMESVEQHLGEGWDQED